MNGQLEQVGERWRLRFVRHLAHQPHKVWAAITEREHLKAWFPHEIVGEWKPGAKLEFKSDSAEANFDGEVVAYEPPRLLEFRWGTDTIRLEIVPEERGSALTLLDTFDERGKASRDGAGWHVCLDALERELAGGGSAADSGGDWDRVHADYVKAFGPEASTIGPPASTPSKGSPAA